MRIRIFTVKIHDYQKPEKPDSFWLVRSVDTENNTDHKANNGGRGEGEIETDGRRERDRDRETDRN